MVVAISHSLLFVTSSFSSYFFLFCQVGKKKTEWTIHSFTIKINSTCMHDFTLDEIAPFSPLIAKVSSSLMRIVSAMMLTSIEFLRIRITSYLHASFPERLSNGSQVASLKGYPTHFTWNSSLPFLFISILITFSIKNFLSSSLLIRAVYSDTILLMNAFLFSSVIPISICNGLDDGSVFFYT